jgi:hydrogenase expression/formation protein HypC
MCLAIPAKIVELFPDRPESALVEVGGVRRHIDTGLLQDEDAPKAGDWVLIHVGFAMSRISEEDALDQLRTLALLGETDAALEEVQGYGVNDS